MGDLVESFGVTLEKANAARRVKTSGALIKSGPKEGPAMTDNQSSTSATRLPPPRARRPRMPKLEISAFERYPDWDWEETDEAAEVGGMVFEVDEATYQRWRAAATAYEDAQHEIGAMVEHRAGRERRS
jgi:hypothetical protein